MLTASAEKINPTVSKVIARPAQELKGFVYRPMLVGYDFPRKIRIPIEGSILLFSRSGSVVAGRWA